MNNYLIRCTNPDHIAFLDALVSRSGSANRHDLLDGLLRAEGRRLGLEMPDRCVSVEQEGRDRSGRFKPVKRRVG